MARRVVLKSIFGVIYMQYALYGGDNKLLKWIVGFSKRFGRRISVWRAVFE